MVGTGAVRQGSREEGELVARYDRMIRGYARAFDRKKDSFDDLVQEGRLITLRAIRSYDPEKASLTTHVAFKIQRGLYDWNRSRDGSWTPVSDVRTYLALRNRFPDPPTEPTAFERWVSDCAKALDIPESRVHRALTVPARQEFLSLFYCKSFNPSRPNYECFEGEEHCADPGPGYDEDEWLEAKAILDLLPARERGVLIDRSNGQAYSEIAKELGVCETRAFQLYRQGIDRARKIAAGREVPGRDVSRKAA